MNHPNRAPIAMIGGFSGALVSMAMGGEVSPEATVAVVVVCLLAFVALL